MNVHLLEAVQQTISGNPDCFCAAQWAFARNAERVLADGVSPVGFRCCIAGHVLLESGTLGRRDLLRKGGFHTGGALWDRAADVLGVSRGQSRELFFPSQWVHPFKKRYYLCTREEEAQVATAYLDHFIEKHAPDQARRATPMGAGERDNGRPPRAPSADEDHATGERVRLGTTVSSGAA